MIFKAIGGAIKGVIFGVLMVVGAGVLLVFNEHNAKQDIDANAELDAKGVSIGNESVDPGMEGALVHVNGPAETAEILENKRFGIAENAIRIVWDAKIYQWVEEVETDSDTDRKTYTYKKEWVNDLINSSNFNKPAGHENTGKKEFKSGRVQAKDVSLGAFKLPGALISKMEAYESYTPKELPEAVAGKGTLSGNVFHTGTPGSPEIGDEKVEFRIVRPGGVSVLAVQTGNSFSEFTAKNGKTRFILYDGLLSKEEVVTKEKQKAAALRWGLRGGGVFLMFFGFLMIARPLTMMADMVPIFGNLVGGAVALFAGLLAIAGSSIIIAISWVTVRPLVGIPLLLVGVGAIFLLVKQLKGQKRLREPVPPPYMG